MILLLFLLAQPPAASPAPIDLAAFITTVHSLSAAVRATPAADAERIRATLPGRWVVRHQKAQYSVSTRWLADALAEAARSPAAWEKRREELAARLTQMQTEAEELRDTAADRADAEHARAALTAVLARPEYTRSRQHDALAQLRQKVVDWISTVWRRLGGNRLAQRSTAKALAWAAATVALGGLLWWLVSMLRRDNESARLAFPPPPVDRRSARSWARAAAGATDPREAVRCAYRALISQLEEEGTWRIDESRTPREYVRLLSSTHRRRSIAAEVARRFEEIWYGGRQATAEDAGLLLTRLRELGCLTAN